MVVEIPLSNKNFHPLISGRNGDRDIKALSLTDGAGRLFIDGISAARGVAVKGGFVIPTEAIPELITALVKVHHEHANGKIR